MKEFRWNWVIFFSQLRNDQCRGRGESKQALGGRIGRIQERYSIYMGFKRTCFKVKRHPTNRAERPRRPKHLGEKCKRGKVQNPATGDRHSAKHTKKTSTYRCQTRPGGGGRRVRQRQGVPLRPKGFRQPGTGREVGPNATGTAQPGARARPPPLSRRRSGSNLVDILGDPVHLFRARHDGAGGSRKHHRLVRTQDSTESAGERRPPPQLRSVDVAGEATGRGATLYMASQGRAHPPAAASASTRPQLRLPRVALPWRLPQGAPPGKGRQAGGEAESEWRLDSEGAPGGVGGARQCPHARTGARHPLPFAAHSPVRPAALRHLLARRLTPRTPRTNKQTNKHAISLARPRARK